MEKDPSDKLRDENCGVIEYNTLKSMLDNNDAYEEGVEPMFDIILKYTGTGGLSVTFTSDYQRHPGCPQWIVDKCMPIYTEIKRVARLRKKELVSVLARKKNKSRSN